MASELTRRPGVMVSWGSARLTVVALASCALLISVGGCSDKGPTGPESILTAVVVRGGYFYYHDGEPWGVSSIAAVDVEAGLAGHDTYEVLVVTVGGTRLSNAPGGSVYMGLVPGAAPGQQILFTVSDGIDTISQAVEVPHPPTGLELAGGAWDVSGLYASNTLTWQNPAEAAEQVGVRLVHAPCVDGATPLGGVLLGVPSSESMTVLNSEVWGYSYDSVDSVMGQVFLVNSAPSAGEEYDCEFSAYSGDWNVWSVSGSGRGR
jgi:hypothetical protein